MKESKYDLKASINKIHLLAMEPDTAKRIAKSNAARARVTNLFFKQNEIPINRDPGRIIASYLNEEDKDNLIKSKKLDAENATKSGLFSHQSNEPHSNTPLNKVLTKKK